MKKLLFLLYFFSLVIFSGKLNAHSMQVAYCASCSSVKIYVEHWHKNEIIANAPMSFQVTINGVTTGYNNVLPVSRVLNTPISQLPGCTDTIKVFGACTSGFSLPNTENNWFVYEFPIPSCGQVASVNVVMGNNSVTSAGCGNLFPANTGNLLIPCDSTTQAINITSQTVCSGDSVMAYNFPLQAGVTYAWENSDTLIGLSAFGYGNIPSFIAGNVSSVTTANLKVSYGCKDTTVTITVIPKPIASFSYADFCIGDTTYFSDSSVFYSSPKKWYWDFNLDNLPDDSITSPKYIFSGLPPYNVNLVVIDSLGCKSDTTVTVISASPGAAFTLPVVCKGSSVQITDASTISSPYTISTWQWDVDNNGSIEYTNQNPIHTFNTAGFIPLKLIASSNAGCKDSIIQNVFVQICTSIIEEDDFNILLYPNPFNSKIILETNKVFSNGEIIILNALGDEIKRIDFTANNNFNEINLANLKSGCYIILLKSDDFEWRKQVFKK